MAEGDPKLSLKIDHTKPVELLDLSESFKAFADQYKRYSRESGLARPEGSAKLYVQKIETGSIIAEFFSLTDQLSTAIEHRDIIAGFVTHWIEVTDYFLQKRTDLPKWFTKADARSVGKFLRPVARDNAAQINVIAQEGSEVFIGCTFNSVEANAIQNGVNKYIARTDLPEDEVFDGQTLYIYQAKDDPKATTGERGIMPVFSDKPIKVKWHNQEAKKAVLEQDVFHTGYTVTGKVTRHEGEPKEYLIYEVQGHFPKQGGKSSH